MNSNSTTGDLEIGSEAQGGIKKQTDLFSKIKEGSTKLLQDPTNPARYFVKGNHHKKYEDFLINMEKYTCEAYAEGGLRYIKARDIEGIPLSKYEAEDIDAFWEKGADVTQETYMKIASQTNQVIKMLDAGMDLNMIKESNSEYIECVERYFENAPAVDICENIYIYKGNGRYKEIAAQTVNAVIPVRIDEIIRRKV